MNQSIHKAEPVSENLAEMSPEAMQRMLHELQVQNIELAMHNKELRRTQEDLADTQARYSDLYDQAPVGYVTLSESGRILEANLTATTLLGITRDELVTQSISRFISEEYHSSFHGHCQRLFETGAPQNCELPMVKNDGTRFWAHHAAKVTRDVGGQQVCHVVITDITGRKQIAAALRLKSFVFDESISANSIADLEGTITEANAAYLRVWGYAHEHEVVGKPIPHFFYDLNEAFAILTALKSTGQWEGEFTAKRKDGSTFIAHSVATTVRDENGKLIGYQSAVMDITGRKLMEAELSESEQRFHTLAMFAPVGIYLTDHEGYCLYANAAWCKMAGLDLQEALGMGWTHGIHPEDLDTVMKDWKRMTESQGQWSLEYRFRNRDGEVTWVQGLATPQHDAAGNIIRYVGVNLDITERKQAELILRDWNRTLEQRVVERTLELQQSKDHLHQLAGATFEGIAISEGDILIDGNPQLALLFGYELGEMIDRPVVDFMAPESRPTVARNIRDEHEITFEFVGLRKDGSTFPGEAHARMSQWQGRETRISALRDLTTIKQAAAKLQAQQIELEHALSLAMVSEVSAGIIHQLGQPLCAIGANLAVALDRVKACESQGCGSLEILKDVEADIARMRDAILHLRLLAHPEQPTHQWLDINHLVAGVLGLLRQEADNRQVLLENGCDHDLPLVQGDAVQLSQVILNLVRNAFDACANCPPDRRRVAIMACPLADGGVELSVRDSGTGITPEAMARMFTAFFTTKPEGLGIGLRLCQTIVEAHRGSVKGGNNAGGIGATFRVALPGHSSSSYTKHHAT
ncbi:MAG: PAS domain S-box protein [Verrucomicrobia bacterium]|nr:PAS domain S-box protein [Verrucomicrobiota bacterium]